MTPENYFRKPVTMEMIPDMDRDSERIFAFACLEMGLILYSQIPTGGSVIDFLVINPKRHPDLKLESGKLVEVTLRDQASIQHHCPPKGRFDDSPEGRKQRQIQNMIASGQDWTILYGQHISNIKNSFGDPDE